MNQITGFNAPTDKTIGAIGDIYTNANTGIKYECVGIYTVKTDVTYRYYAWIRVDTKLPGTTGGTNGMVTSAALLSPGYTVMDGMSLSVEIEQEEV